MESIRLIASRLDKEGERIFAFFRALDEQVWNQMVYTDGASWTVREILAHFVESEGALARLIGVIVSGAAGMPENFEIDRYNESHVPAYLNKTNSELMSDFILLRTDTVRMVLEFSESDLMKRGRHPFLGEATVEEMLKLMVVHLQLHIRDIRRITNARQ